MNRSCARGTTRRRLERLGEQTFDDPHQSRSGLHGNVLRTKPRMCITKPDADFLVDCLDEVIATM